MWGMSSFPPGNGGVFLGLFYSFRQSGQLAQGARCLKTRGKGTPLGFGGQREFGQQLRIRRAAGDPQGMFLANRAGEMGRTHAQSSPSTAGV